MRRQANSTPVGKRHGLLSFIFSRSWTSALFIILSYKMSFFMEQNANQQAHLITSGHHCPQIFTTLEVNRLSNYKVEIVRKEWEGGGTTDILPTHRKKRKSTNTSSSLRFSVRLWYLPGRSQLFQGATEWLYQRKIKGL